MHKKDLWYNAVMGKIDKIKEELKRIGK